MTLSSKHAPLYVVAGGIIAVFVFVALTLALPDRAGLLRAGYGRVGSDRYSIRLSPPFSRMAVQPGDIVTVRYSGPFRNLRGVGFWLVPAGNDYQGRDFFLGVPNSDDGVLTFRVPKVNTIPFPHVVTYRGYHMPSGKILDIGDSLFIQDRDGGRFGAYYRLWLSDTTVRPGEAITITYTGYAKLLLAPEFLMCVDTGTPGLCRARGRWVRLARPDLDPPPGQSGGSVQVTVPSNIRPGAYVVQYRSKSRHHGWYGTVVHDSVPLTVVGNASGNVLNAPSGEESADTAPIAQEPDSGEPQPVVFGEEPTVDTQQDIPAVAEENSGGRAVLPRTKPGQEETQSSLFGKAVKFFF